MGPFTIEHELGKGGMGVVYLATYNKNNQKVALKVLAPDIAADEHLSARFLREMEILKKLKHPNIVKYFGGGVSQKQPYYAMEQVAGGSLEEKLQRKKKFSWEDTVKYGIQVCEALEYAHANGVIHRDLKPANLLVEKRGKLKLTDFGIARDTKRTALTAAGKTVGTFDYMAPEQISGKYPISHKTDLYALGCVLFEMMTGQTPFHSENAPETLFKHMDATPPTIRELVMECPVWLEKLVSKLLEKEPDDRPYDALAVKVSLEEVIKKVRERASVANFTAKDRKLTDGSTVPGTKKKRKKKKKKSQDPVWEQGWFLGVLLAGVVGIAIWFMLPLSEAQLYARAVALMDENTRLSKLNAKEKYLEPLIERFPEGEYAGKAQEYLDDMAMADAERKIETRIKQGREPKSEAERLYRDAYKFEEFGDNVTAKTRYQALVDLMKDSTEEKPVVNLARRQILKLNLDDEDQTDRAVWLIEMLVEADKLYGSGKVPQARQKWEAIIALYGNNLEFKPQIDQARARLAGDFTKSIPMEKPAEKKLETKTDSP